MKQAIEEGFILDVLRGYHSFKLAFQVGAERRRGGDRGRPGRGHQGGRCAGSSSTRRRSRRRSAIIVEHFRENVADLLDGHAKAMVVTDSRKAAVRYKLAIDKYIATKGYGYGTLVAFSGAVSDPESGPDDFTEASHEPGRARPAHRVPG